MAAENPLVEIDRLDPILSRVTEGITIQEPSGRLVYANPAGLALIGFTELEELLDAAPGEVLDRFQLLHEDGTPLERDELPGRRALLGEVSPPIVLRFRVKATGEERYAVVRSEPILDADGRVTQVVNTFHDVTDEKQASQALRFLSDAGAVLSASLDYEETLRNLARLAVPVFADWCAIDVLDDEGGVQRVGIHHSDTAKLAFAEEFRSRFPPNPDAPTGVYSVMQTGRAMLAAEVTDEQLAASPDAARYGPEYVELMRQLGIRSAIVAPLLAGERVIGAITLVISESKRSYGPRDLSVAELLGARAGLAVQNSRLYREAADAVTLRDRFLQVAAHELLTPVTIVRGYAQSLERLVERQREAAPGSTTINLEAARLGRTVRQVDRASERLTQLVGDLLDVTRLHSGSLVPVPRPMNLSAVVRSTLEGVNVQQTEGRYATNVDLSFDLPEDGDIVGTWDETRIEQVLFNVLDNALKYSSDGDAVNLRLWLDGDEARIDISDTGLGIPADQLEAIFQPFHRTRDANVRAAGMGMGLAVCREIVNRHGGWIRASSPGSEQGSTFSIGLPGASLSAAMVGVEPA
ncbi:MAG TPA: ATP-binding protein [Candidatus Limnocylindria bacterium]|nr:ATP-binding protein [Candidatus Limnocylindria bacterium]